MATSKSFTEKKTDLQTKRQQLAEKLAKLEAAEKERQRKHETAQRLIVGRIVLAHAKDNAHFARLLAGMLDTAVTRPDERKIIADLVNLDSTANDTQPATETGNTSAQPDETHTASTSKT